MEPIDRPALPRRHLALLLLVVLVPFSVLTALAIRTLTQDRELAVRREEDERRQLAVTVRQEFQSRLESLKLQAVSSTADAQDDRSRAPGAPIVLVARVDGARLVLPWENPAAASEVRRVLSVQPYAGLISQGETEELVRQRPGSAATIYRRALSAARHPSQAGSAELFIARAQGKAGQPAEALKYSRATLARSISLVDEQGVPFALYASRRVADLEGLTTEDARAALDVARQASAASWTSPSAVHMAAAVVSKLRSRNFPEIQALTISAQETIAAEVARGEQASALQQTFPALARQFPSTAAPGGQSLWLPFGQGPWVISLTADIGNRQPILVAVDAVKAFERLESAARCVAAGGCRLAMGSGAGPDDYPLGPALPGLTLLRVRNDTAGESQRWLPRLGFYVVALSLVLTLAVFGAYLLWRDVRRELHVAELRSQFVASVSHELKTPLTAIRMFAETLRMGRKKDPAVRDEYLDIIINESERLTRLLNNVLDFSRIESGRKIYQFAPNDLSSIVRTAARAMHYPLAQQGFELQVDIGDHIPPVHGDPDALEQAILNLLANALKYSGNARKIELRLVRDGAHAVIAVRDWGIGIEPADQRRIFDKFYRVARPENRLIPGTGLGLTLVDHIARSHHGFVAVESAPGAGSTFRIHVPLALGEPVSAGKNSEAERPSAAVERRQADAHEPRPSLGGDPAKPRLASPKL
jgi:signal transduction histidine kinase